MAKKPEGAELVCSFCGKGAPNKLIAGPKIFICDECVEKSVEIACDGPSFSQPTAGLTQVSSSQSIFSLLFHGMKRLTRDPPPRCEFCGRTQADLVQPPSPLGRRALICGECRQLCQQIISERLEHI